MPTTADFRHKWTCASDATCLTMPRPTMIPRMTEKHARSDALNLLEPLLVKIRMHPQLEERKPGYFYQKGKLFLHFHEGPAGVFAVLSYGAESWRLRVSEPAEQEALLAKIKQVLRE